jgi:acid phosphatase
MNGARLAGVWMLAVGMAAAQAVPPSCPVPAGQKAVSIRHQTARPTRASVEATAEAGAADPTVLVSLEPMENFGVARYRLADYADCVGEGGCYWSDLEAQTRRAEMAFEAELKTRKDGERLAMVLDIDETSLSSYCEEKREDFGFIAAMFNAWIVSPEASIAVPGTLRLFHKARAAGIAVFFITGRPEEQRAATERNLAAAGYHDWAGLRLRDADERSMATVAYKSLERKKIVDAGYRLVMNVGDQWSDLNGAPRGEVSVKLPNPFYYLP